MQKLYYLLMITSLIIIIATITACMIVDLQHLFSFRRYFYKKIKRSRETTKVVIGQSYSGNFMDSLRDYFTAIQQNSSSVQTTVTVLDDLSIRQ